LCRIRELKAAIAFGSLCLMLIIGVSEPQFDGEPMGGLHRESCCSSVKAHR